MHFPGKQLLFFAFVLENKLYYGVIKKTTWLNRMPFHPIELPGRHTIFVCLSIVWVRQTKIDQTKIINCTEIAAKRVNPYRGQDQQLARRYCLLFSLDHKLIYTIRRFVFASNPYYISDWTRYNWW